MFAPRRAQMISQGHRGQTANNTQYYLQIFRLQIASASIVIIWGDLQNFKSFEFISCNSNCSSMLWNRLLLSNIFIGMRNTFPWCFRGHDRIVLCSPVDINGKNIVIHRKIWISIGVKEFRIVCLTFFNFSKSLSLSSLFWLSTASLKHLKIEWMNERVSSKVRLTHFSCLTSPYVFCMRVLGDVALQKKNSKNKSHHSNNHFRLV